MERRGIPYWLLIALGTGALANGVAMLALPEDWFARIAAVAAMFHGLHGAIHVFDVAAGVQPPSHLLEDLPGVYLPTLALIAIAVHALRQARTAP